MKSFVTLITEIFCLSMVNLLFQTNCPAQKPIGIVPAIDLDGIADFVPYSGIQPELVAGTNGKTVTGRPVLRHVYLVVPNILALTIDEYGFVRNGTIPYRPESGDSVSFHEDLVIKRVWEEAGITPFLFLFGKAVPSGRFTVSVPQSVGQVPVFYNYKPAARGVAGTPGSPEHPRKNYVFSSTEPLFPFGFGLSYTQFEYSDLRIA